MYIAIGASERELLKLNVGKAKASGSKTGLDICKLVHVSAQLCAKTLINVQIQFQ